MIGFAVRCDNCKPCPGREHMGPSLCLIFVAAFRHGLQVPSPQQKSSPKRYLGQMPNPSSLFHLGTIELVSCGPLWQRDAAASVKIRKASSQLQRDWRNPVPKSCLCIVPLLFYLASLRICSELGCKLHTNPGTDRSFHPASLHTVESSTLKLPLWVEDHRDVSYTKPKEVLKFLVYLSFP